MYGRYSSLAFLLTLSVVAWHSSEAEAQIVRRFPGGGVAVRAPFVRVDVDPWGRTSVRAPFVAVDDPGAVRVGPRRRLARRQWRAERRAVLEQQETQAYSQFQTPAPTPAEVPALPTAEEMAEMELIALVSTLRDMSRLFQDSLVMRFEDPEGWQRYLAIPDDALGSPGMDEVALRMDVLERQLERYRKVAEGEKFAKIGTMPSFAATHAALELVVERFENAGPALVEPVEDDWQSDPGPVTAPQNQESLPVPPRPEPRSGERSILKRG